MQFIMEAPTDPTMTQISKSKKMTFKSTQVNPFQKISHALSDLSSSFNSLSKLSESAFRAECNNYFTKIRAFEKSFLACLSKLPSHNEGLQSPCFNLSERFLDLRYQLWVFLRETKNVRVELKQSVEKEFIISAYNFTSYISKVWSSSCQNFRLTCALLEHLSTRIQNNFDQEVSAKLKKF